MCKGSDPWARYLYVEHQGLAPGKPLELRSNRAQDLPLSASICCIIAWNITRTVSKYQCNKGRKNESTEISGNPSPSSDPGLKWSDLYKAVFTWWNVASPRSPICYAAVNLFPPLNTKHRIAAVKPSQRGFVCLAIVAAGGREASSCLWRKQAWALGCDNSGYLNRLWARCSLSNCRLF